ncbi:Basic helix-loop-helix DNA-binding superfamily protein [Dorcoceras hygrometricum]|uniref:Basic helix-loop-helix DNA-binding superfamily protein n=1 Tax=Dorcoceras hygrometricum TaxID=472368 RepID=A0A2Z7CN10_9LAMI|nr:Basic helix-loop-helix DNA-binding superfamily protein [Dorcoceras hygrometricum]
MNSQSAFSSYTNEPRVGFASKSNANGSNRENVHKRMLQFLKKNWSTNGGRTGSTTGEMERGRGKKHVMGERLRRETHRRFYGALHELLPPGTKRDQKSILETTIKKIKELQKMKEELERRNNEVEIILGARENEVTLEKAEIELKVGNPASGIDSMLEVLRSLKYTNSTATAMHSNFSQRQFSAKLEIETKMRAADVEREVRRSLFQVETKFHRSGV